MSCTDKKKPYFTGFPKRYYELKEEIYEKFGMLESSDYQEIWDKVRKEKRLSQKAKNPPSIPQD
jgi:phage anti-repressor protein